MLKNLKVLFLLVTFIEDVKLTTHKAHTTNAMMTICQIHAADEISAVYTMSALF
jgi:hypothetical protein